MQEDWRVYHYKADFRQIANRLHIPEPMAIILRNRGLRSLEEMQKYLYGSEADLYDPFLMKGMKEGVWLLAETIKKRGKVRIIGDFDADGVCASYILETFLSAAGADVSVKIPNRVTEGYGLNLAMVEAASRDNISLLLTCDNGISALAEVKRAKELGISVVITDHHEPLETLPEAQVIMDPKQPGCTYPFRELCGAGIAYKYMQALNESMGLHLDALLKYLLQFAAIATIADIVPLQDENRILASEGLKVLRETQNPGLKALAQIRNIRLKEIRSEMISFNIAPCINSAGRLESADLALNLFRAKDLEEAWHYAKQLSMLNEKRKELMNALVEQVLQDLNNKEPSSLERILVIYLPDAHESLAGLIAGKLMDMFYRPVLVVTNASGKLKGSARSTPQYDIIRAVREHEELFEKSGGHKRACGFTLKWNGTAEETVKRLSETMNRSCTLTDQDLQRKVWIDLALSFQFLNVDFIDRLEMLEPYGADNEKPLFGSSHVSVSSCEVIGRNSNALKLAMADTQGFMAEGVMFGKEEQLRGQCELLQSSPNATVIFHLSVNEYQGRRSPQAVIQKIRVLE